MTTVQIQELVTELKEVEVLSDFCGSIFDLSFPKTRLAQRQKRITKEIQKLILIYDYLQKGRALKTPG